MTSPLMLAFSCHADLSEIVGPTGLRLRRPSDPAQMDKGLRLFFLVVVVRIPPGRLLDAISLGLVPLTSGRNTFSLSFRPLQSGPDHCHLDGLPSPGGALPGIWSARGPTRESIVTLRFLRAGRTREPLPH